MSIENLNLHISFYKSASNKQNMWIDHGGVDGERYEINEMEGIKSALQKYLEQRNLVS